MICYKLLSMTSMPVSFPLVKTDKIAMLSAYSEARIAQSTAMESDN